MSGGEYPSSANCAFRDLTIVTSRCCESGSTTCCVVGLLVGFQEASGTAPLSEINVPLGCTTRKHATDRSVVETSSFFNWKRPISAMWRVPQSITYSLSERRLWAAQ